MEHVREIAKKLVAEMTGKPLDCDREAAGKQLRRLAVIDYASYLKHSPELSEEINNRAMEKAYMFYYRAIEAGVPESDMEKSFSDLRAYWIPRLARSTYGK